MAEHAATALDEAVPAFPGDLRELSEETICWGFEIVPNRLPGGPVA